MNTQTDQSAVLSDQLASDDAGRTAAVDRNVEVAADGFVQVEPGLAIGPDKGRRLTGELATLIKYFGIGVSAMAIDVGLFLLLYNVFDLGTVASQSISVSVAVLYSFAMNARYNFKVSDRLAARFLGFVAVSFVGYLVGLAIIKIVSDGFDLNASVGKIVGLPVVFIVQYALNSRLSFKANSQSVTSQY